MTGNEISLTILASVFGLVATILSILTFFKKGSKEKSEDAKYIAENISVIKTDNEYIKDGIAELKDMVKDQANKQHVFELKLQTVEHKVEDVDRRLNIVERSMKKTSTRKGAN